MANAYKVVIPARYASTRLPGKPLRELHGKPMLQHVFEAARQCGAEQIVIATDDERIEAAGKGFGAEVCMTSAEHASGTDRLAEVAEKFAWSDDEIVVNLQGDEPLMPAACLDQAAALLAGDDRAEVASLYWPVASAEEVTDPNVVKVVTAGDGAALYFSRSAIPHPRGAADIATALQAGLRWKRHIGLYAYRASALRAFTTMSPAPLERVEKLEQLRFLESGRRIVMARATEFIPAGVDTPRDLERVRAMLGLPS